MKYEISKVSWRLFFAGTFALIFLSFIARILPPTSPLESHYRAPLTDDEEERAPIEDWAALDSLGRSVANMGQKPIGLGDDLASLVNSTAMAEFRRQYGRDWQLVVNEKKGQAVLLGGRTDIDDAYNPQARAAQVLKVFGFSTGVKIAFLGFRVPANPSAEVQIDEGDVPLGNAERATRVAVFDQYVDFRGQRLFVHRGQLELYFTGNGRLYLGISRLRWLRYLDYASFSQLQEGAVDGELARPNAEGASGSGSRVVFVDRFGVGSCARVVRGDGRERVAETLVACVDPRRILEQK